MIFIYNQNEEQIKILDIEYKFTREINQVNTLEFECEYDFEKGYRAVIFEENKPYEFVIVDSDYTREDISTFVYFCRDSIIENAGNPILDKRPSGSHKVALNSIFENTRWTVEYDGSFSESHTQSNSFFRISVLEALSQIIEEYNLEWYTKFLFTDSNITTRTIVIGKIGSKSNSRLEFGKNIQSFKRRILPDTIITALYGYGKGEELESGAYGRRLSFSSINNGLDYVTNEAAKLKYGIGPKTSKKHVFDFFIDENETDINNLLKNTKKELDRRSQVQAEYTVNAIDLNLDASFGYTLDVLDEEIEFSGSVRIIKEVREAGNVEFTFGHITKSFLNQISKEIQKSSEKTKIEVTSLMETRLNEITDVYFGEDGYNYDLPVSNEYNLPAGLYSFNKPIDQNPTKVIYFGAGKMLIADSQNPDGTWNFRTAITPEGIIGDEVVTGTVTANKLSSDVGQMLDISSNESIRNLVTNSEYNENQELINQRFSEVLQTGSNLEISISEIISKVNENKALTDNEFEFIKTYFNFASDGLEIGKTSSEMTLKLLNDRISFLDTGNEVAYISDNKLEIFDGNFMNSLGLGRFEFVPRESGNLSFRLKRN